ncbi:Uncharacterized protein HZ326_14301 [Fusarium oxysporum f. sp. albedinis]|nr:Uncharacterized protein HZ326_14301 [Fusarium oxysporum f. sp. albedinis]
MTGAHGSCPADLEAKDRYLQMTGIEVLVTALTALASRSPPPRNLHLRHHAACVSLSLPLSSAIAHCHAMPCHVMDLNALSFVVTNTQRELVIFVTL